MLAKIARIYQYYQNSRILKLVVAPIVLVSPPLFLAASKYNVELDGFFNSYSYMATICAFWPLTYAFAGYFSHFMRPLMPVDTERLMSLFDIIDDIIGVKIERFGTEAQKILSSNIVPSADKVFNTITQPELQIPEIVKGIWTFFSYDVNPEEVNIRVALARMGEKHIDKFDCFYPRDLGPRSDVSKLRVDYCTFSRAKSQKSIIVIPDIAKEARKGLKSNFVVTSEELTEESGSMICYPVIHRNLNDIPFVLSICASKKNHFKESGEKYYKFVIDKFVKRIRLEYGLQVIKEAVGQKE